MGETPSVASRGFYDGAVPRAEEERLRGFKYPDQVSARFIPADLTDQIVLDVGAGPNPTLQGLVTERHGRYVALDINQQFLKARPEGARVRADSQALPFESKGVDMVHERFMFMHLPPYVRRGAIAEMARVGKQIVALEWDWQSWSEHLAVQRRDHQWDPDFAKALTLLQRFLANARVLGAALGIEMDMGRKLESEVAAAIGRRPVARRIERPLQQDYTELVQLGQMQAAMWRAKTSNKQKVKDMEEIVRGFEALSPEERLPYPTADIVAVQF